MIDIYPKIRNYSHMLVLGGNRVAVLRDGRRVVMTERVHEFLEWAQNYYDISVCSLG